MEKRIEILELIDQYIRHFPTEAKRIELIKDFVQRQDGDELYDRKNFTGHITASAFIVDPNNKSLLLLKHKALERWLQPGGHVDLSDASIKAAAIREAQEETGIPAIHLVSIGDFVFDFDSHYIPANLKKQEPAHYHHDVRFAFAYSAGQQVKIADQESTESRWFPFEEVHENNEFSLVIKKLKTHLKERQLVDSVS